MVALKTDKKSSKNNKAIQDNAARPSKNAPKKVQTVIPEEESDSENSSEEMTKKPVLSSKKSKKLIPSSEMSINSKKQKSQESNSDDEIEEEDDSADSENISEENDSENLPQEEDRSDEEVTENGEEDDSSDVDLETGEEISEVFSEDDNDSPVDVMLGNLSSRTSTDDLKELLNSATVKYSKMNRNERTATLTVMAGSLKKILNLIGTKLNNRKLAVIVPEEISPEVSFQKRSAKPLSEENCCVFVKNLDYSTTNESLQEAFDGSLSARVIQDRETGRSKGFGYVDFATSEEAKFAIENVGSVDGRNVFTDFATARGSTTGSAKSNDMRGGFRGGRGFKGDFRGGRGGYGSRGDFRGGRGGNFRGGRGRGQAKHFTFDE